MALQSGTLCHKLCIDWGAARLIYLLSSSFIVFGFTVEMIVIGLIVAPYLRDAEFKPATCQFNSSRYTGYTDCQDVNRRPNNFPCLEVLVNFRSNSSYPGSGLATIYTVLSYYEDASNGSKCSSRICYRDSQLNVKQIANLNVSLYNGNASYSCFVRQEWGASTYAALRTREISEEKVFHCLLWPNLMFGVGGLIFWSTYCCLGCKVWPKQVSL